MHTIPIAGFGMSVQPQVAKGSTGLLIAATRSEAGRERQEESPSPRRLASIGLTKDIVYSFCTVC